MCTIFSYVYIYVHTYMYIHAYSTKLRIYNVNVHLCDLRLVGNDTFGNRITRIVIPIRAFRLRQTLKFFLSRIIS